MRAGAGMQVDSAGIGKRETDLRLTPGGSAPRSKATKRRWADDLTWDDVPWFRSITKMPLVLKGVQSGADALMAYEIGLEGVVVGNHGGRNMDTARPALEALIEVMATLRKSNYDPAKFQVRMYIASRPGLAHLQPVATLQHASSLHAAWCGTSDMRHEWRRECCPAGVC
jgi:FMN-dependent dehydrogenase